MSLLKTISDAIKGKVPLSLKRSSKWPSVRAKYLAKHNKCAVCGGIKSLELHHIQAFHLHPELELDETNFIPLCEASTHGVNCHLFFGHLGDYKKENLNVVNDAEAFRQKLESI